MKIAKSNKTSNIHHDGQRRYFKMKKIKQANKRKENTVSSSALCFDHIQSYNNSFFIR